MRIGLPLTGTCVLLFLSLSVFAQKTGKITGVVSDTARQPLGSATVTLMVARDSSIERMELSDAQGRFSLTGVRPNAYLLIISEVNHESFVKNIAVTDTKKEWLLDTVRLAVKSNDLDMITIVRQRPPVLIKPDTVEFDAAAIKVRENDMVEELLKKLPGIEIAKDGTVQVQGEKVTRVLVDGKPFFGNDPRMATQNLPANIIDKIQLIDKKSEQAQVTKVEDGQVEKVINITIRKDRKKGYFGRGYMGYGTEQHYETRLSANHFSNEKKISFLGGGNNTGRSDNSFGNNEEVPTYNNSNGINREWQSRVNYADKWGKKLDGSINVAWSSSRNNTEQSRQRQTILGDSTNYYAERSSSQRDRSGFSGGLFLEYKPDTLTRITINRSASFSKNEYSSWSEFNSKLVDDRRINEGDRRNYNHSNTPSHNGNITASRSFKKKGRGLFLNLNDNINNSLSDALNNSNNYFYPISRPEYARILNQISNNDNRSTSINGSVSFSEPVSKKSSLSLSYSYGYSKNNTLRETFDFNNQTQLYDLINDTLSNRFNNYNYNESVGLTYNYRIKKGNLSLGATWQNNRTKSVAVTKDSIYRQSFAGWVPHASYNFYENGKRLTITYNYGARPPQAYQLQSVIDNSNPLYLRLGNPRLQYATTHRVNFNAYYFKQKTGISVNSNGNINITVNNISNSTSFDKATGVQTSMPVNLDGVYNGFGRIYFSKTVKWFGNNNSVYSSVNTNFSQNNNRSNGSPTKRRNLGRRISLGMNMDIKEFADLSFGYNYGVQNTRYSLRKEQNNRTVTNGFESRLRLTPNKQSELSIEWEYNRNRGNAAGFNRQVNMVNADLTQYLNKKKSWWLKLKVYDLLKQNVNVYRWSGETFLEDTQTNIITRFFLLSVNAKLNRFGNTRPGARQRK